MLIDILPAIIIKLKDYKRFFKQTKVKVYEEEGINQEEEIFFRFLKFWEGKNFFVYTIIKCVNHTAPIYTYFYNFFDFCPKIMLEVILHGKERDYHN